jgi:hypothetical protein
MEGGTTREIRCCAAGGGGTIVDRYEIYYNMFCDATKKGEHALAKKESCQIVLCIC